MLPIRVLVVVGVTFLLQFSPGIAAGQTTSLQLKSQPGDFIGGGVDQTFTPADGTFTAFRNFNNGVAINFNGGPHWWYLNFAAPQGACSSRVFTRTQPVGRFTRRRDQEWTSAARVEGAIC